jgi:hypothetical protein
MMQVYNTSTQDMEAGGSQIQGQPELHSLKNTKSQADGVAQVREPSKCEALGSNSSTTKKQNKTNKQKNQSGDIAQWWSTHLAC